jgi:hypothetical protein
MISVSRARNRAARISLVLVLRVLSQTVLWMLWMEAAGVLNKLCVAALVRMDMAPTFTITRAGGVRNRYE